MDCHINDCHISRLLGLWLGDLEFSAMHFPKHPRMKAHKQGNKIRECWGGKPFGECWDDQVVLVKTSKLCDRSVNLTMGDGVCELTESSEQAWSELVTHGVEPGMLSEMLGLVEIQFQLK